MKVSVPSVMHRPSWITFYPLVSKKKPIFGLYGKIQWKMIVSSICSTKLVLLKL